MSLSEALEVDHTQIAATALCQRLAALVPEAFGAHPFVGPIERKQLDVLLPEYLAMSQAFPYLQAAAQKDVMFDVIARNGDMPVEFELMLAVGSFLTWDEAGGHEVIQRHGKAGLPHILDSDRWFHANILRKDIAKILGRPARPHYGPETHRYLHTLYRGLASTDSVRRCAYMVAFELHANAMISSLWGSVSAVTGIGRDQLEYFDVHVGGDDPAERYHVAITQRLIARVVPLSQYERFVAEFRDAYEVNVAWCRAIAEQPRALRLPNAGAEISHRGSCHCGGVRFAVRAPAAIKAVRCNCSICERSGFLHLLVPADSFDLLAGEELLATYQFGTNTAKHTFCSRCGVKAFYRPRSNPQGFSVNVHCLDQATVEGVDISDFDGQRWEESIHELSSAQ